MSTISIGDRQAVVASIPDLTLPQEGGGAVKRPRSEPIRNRSRKVMEHAGETRATSSQAHRAERRRMSTSLQNLATDQPDHHHLRRSWDISRARARWGANSMRFSRRFYSQVSSWRERNVFSYVPAPGLPRIPCCVRVKKLLKSTFADEIRK
ncbi:hypothetical protein AND_000898 [Anopheles darlingi]|uniref:Uncharacterized protein n=1 Tax=Anopheles darlingi TaxID=43151 RepID=W5JT28_ANODA|nr:hypothetical protein AND_000898 [Anopheles darlingi]